MQNINRTNPRYKNLLKFNNFTKTYTFRTFKDFLNNKKINNNAKSEANRISKVSNLFGIVLSISTLHQIRQKNKCTE